MSKLLLKFVALKCWYFIKSTHIKKIQRKNALPVLLHMLPIHFIVIQITLHRMYTSTNPPMMGLNFHNSKNIEILRLNRFFYLISLFWTTTLLYYWCFDIQPNLFIWSFGQSYSPLKRSLPSQKMSLFSLFVIMSLLALDRSCLSEGQLSKCNCLPCMTHSLT